MKDDHQLWTVFVVPVLALLAAAWKGVRSIVRTEHKVDVMWDAHIRRAKMLTIKKNLATPDHPLIASDEVREWYAPIIDDLKSFYAQYGRKLSERNLYVAVEAKFGEWLVENVCRPQGINEFECITLAIAIASD